MWRPRGPWTPFWALVSLDPNIALPGRGALCRAGGDSYAGRRERLRAGPAAEVLWEGTYSWGREARQAWQDRRYTWKDMGREQGQSLGAGEEPVLGTALPCMDGLTVRHGQISASVSCQDLAKA